MNRVSYLIPVLTTSMMTPIERSRGRFMRAPDEPYSAPGAPPPVQTGGGESSSDPNNQNGNSAESGNSSTAENNGGQALDLTKFWEGKPEAPVDTSAEDTRLSQELGGQLKSMIDGFTPPALVFTKEFAEQIAEGNFEGINEAVQSAHRAAIQSSVVASANLIKQVVTRLQSDFETRIQSALGNKDNSDFLKQTFPQAKDPALAPMIQRVWDQALTNAKGNREDAIRQTRGMLQAMGRDFVPDDLRNPPADPTAGINTSASKSFVDSLLER